MANKGRGWHGDPEGHKRAGAMSPGNQTRGADRRGGRRKQSTVMSDDTGMNDDD